MAVLLAEVYLTIVGYRDENIFALYAVISKLLIVDVEEKLGSRCATKQGALADLLYKSSNGKYIRQKAFDHFC